MTVVRLEQAGRLTSVKLLGAEKGKGFNIVEEVQRIARGEAPPDA
jgi:hypothetical protein